MTSCVRMRRLIPAAIALLLVGGSWVGFGAADDEEERAARAIDALRRQLTAKLQDAERAARAGRVDDALERVVEGACDLGAGASDVYAVAGRERASEAPPSKNPPGRVPAARLLPGLGSGPGAGVPTRASRAILAALAWLAAHQSPDGSWGAAGFNTWCDGKPIANPSARPDGLGKALYDHGVTGLALYAFLRAGYTNRGDHPFAATIARGLRYLGRIQDPEGCFGPRATQGYLYCHGACTAAVVEAYALTGSEVLRKSAQRALDFIALARNPGWAWRYGIKPGDNDTSVMGWMMKPIFRARQVNRRRLRDGQPEPLILDEEAYDGIRAWITNVTDPKSGRVGYFARGSGPARPQDLVNRFPGNKSEAMTAVALVARLGLGEDPNRSRLLKAGVKLCLKLPPKWNPTNGHVDMYYWYYATLALSRVGGQAWDTWRGHLPRAVLDTQRMDGDRCGYRGSWDPIGPWGLDGGRVYSTALLTLCAEAYLRHP